MESIPAHIELTATGIEIRKIKNDTIISKVELKAPRWLGSENRWTIRLGSAWTSTEHRREGLSEGLTEIAERIAQAIAHQSGFTLHLHVEALNEKSQTLFLKREYEPAGERRFVRKMSPQEPVNLTSEEKVGLEHLMKNQKRID